MEDTDLLHDCATYGPKRLFDTELQAPSKCHKAIRPSKALNGNVTDSLDLQFSLLTKYVELCLSSNIIIFQRIGEDSP